MLEGPADLFWRSQRLPIPAQQVSEACVGSVIHAKDNSFAHFLYEILQILIGLCIFAENKVVFSHLDYTNKYKLNNK